MMLVIPWSFLVVEETPEDQHAIETFTTLESSKNEGREGIRGDRAAEVLTIPAAAETANLTIMDHFKVETFVSDRMLLA